MRRPTTTCLLALALLAPLAAAGCGDDGGSPPSDMAASAPQDSAATGAPDLVALPPDMGCWPTPMTHLEILNACTTAQAVDKVPVTPKLNADGTLPPLP